MQERLERPGLQSDGQGRVAVSSRLLGTWNFRLGLPDVHLRAAMVWRGLLERFDILI